MLYLALVAVPLALILAAFLNQVVKQAVVEPVIGGKLPVKVFSEKRRWQVWWEDWKFFVGLGAGLLVSFWI
jgi:hypothetical protein